VKKILMAGVALMALGSVAQADQWDCSEFRFQLEQRRACLDKAAAENDKRSAARAAEARQEQIEQQARADAAGPQVHARICEDLLNSAQNPFMNSTIPPGYTVKSQLEKNLLLNQAQEICQRYYAIDYPEARAAYDAAHGLHQCGATSWCAGK
jgi:hypothetical protein